jgi:hypothetical protein
VTHPVAAPPAVAGNDPAARSLFVTILGWLGVAMGAFGVLVGLLQLAIVGSMAGELAAAANDPQLAAMPPVVRWMFAHYLLLVLVNLAIMALLLVASAGLLRRRNWARLTIVGMLAAGIAANFLGVAVQLGMMKSMGGIAGATAPPEFAAQLAAMRAMVTGFSLLVAVAFAALYGWLIRKLVSPVTRREFGVDVP